MNRKDSLFIEALESGRVCFLHAFYRHDLRTGIYSLLDFKDGRKVDHVRIVAKASGDSTKIWLDLLT